MEIQNKNWSKTKIFRTVLASFAMLTTAMWICWFITDTYFLHSGLTFDVSTHQAIPIDINLYNASYWMGGVFLLFAGLLFAGEIAYIVYRSFAWKTDKNKVIYESVVHGVICLITLVFLILASYRLYNDQWLAVAQYNQAGVLYTINLFHNWYMMDMSILALVSIFCSVTLFQANKAFKFHNIYFDFSLMVAILAVLIIPVYIGAIILIKAHPGVAYPAEFWLHIAGQGLYSSFEMMKAAITIFLIAKLILLIRLNSGQLQRTKRAIVIASILVGVNLIMDVCMRTINYSVREIYNNENWIAQIIMISISFAIAIISGWNSCYRYIELYAKPVRRLDKEPMILN